jgi:membrane-bound inhibitor of C-type lysozyme
MAVTAVLLFICCCSLSSATRIIKPATKPAKATVGSTIELVCVSSETMIWKARSMQLRPAEGHIAIKEENSTLATETLQSTVTISNVTESDTATYECRDESDLLSQGVASIDLKVPKTQKLQIVEFGNTSRLSLSAGDELMLTCVGELRSSPSWIVDGKPLEETMKTIITEAQDSVINSKTLLLTRNNVTHKSSGRYQCVDKVLYQSDSDSYVVFVSATAKMAASSALLFLSAALIFTRFFE